jgi:hypothetical protein
MKKKRVGVPDSHWCKLTLAVDLDLTLTAFPWTSHDYIAQPAKHSQKVLKRFVKAGWQVIIYTCRPNTHMVRAWADLHYPGLISGINCNPDDTMRSGVSLQKPFASIYIDDKNWPLPGGPIDWYTVERDMESRGIFK